MYTKTYNSIGYLIEMKQKRNFQRMSERKNNNNFSKNAAEEEKNILFGVCVYISRNEHKLIFHS